MELTPQQRIDRGRRAQRLAQSEDFEAFLKDAEEAVVAEWKVAPTVEARERSYAKLLALDEIQTAMQRAFNDGAVAEKEQKAQESLAQPQRGL